MQALQAIGRHTEIFYFLPTLALLLGDIQDPKFLARLNSENHAIINNYIDPWFKDEINASSLFNDEGEQNIGNPLLASWEN